MLRLPFAATFALYASLAYAGGPTGGQVTGGSGSISQSGNTTNVVQNSNDLFLNWQSFNLAANDVVNFLQPNASAIAVNRILGSGASQIFGRLNANGQVWLINPNGVLFGKGSQIDVGALTASTLYVSDASLGVDTRTFSGSGTGSIVNDGTIRAANGGYVALLGNQVINQGVISAQLGTVALGAGSEETLTFSGERLIHLTVNQSTLENLADNRQLIEANGGQVIMTAGARNALLASVVNNSGVVEAQTVENHSGTITLLAGMQAGEVKVGGTLDATAPDGGAGGTIETSGATLSLAAGAKVTTGAGGLWRIDPTNLTIDSTAAADIDTSLDGGTSVTEQTTAASASGYGTQSAGLGDITVAAPISWTNSAATLTLSAYNAIYVNAAVNGAGALVMQAANGNMNIASGASIAGSNVTLSTGADFVNLGGANALSASAGGRWLVYSTNPTQDTTGGLTPDFIQYAATAGATPAESTGNALLYSVAPSVTVTALGGSASKTYDGTTAATLTAANSNYTVSGLINGDTVVSMSGTYQSADAGSAINVTSSSSAAGLTVMTSSAIPVYGYGLSGSPVTAAIGAITPALLGAAIAGDPTKVYDGTTTATLTASNYALTGFVTGQGASVNQPSSVAYASPTAGSETVTATFAATNFVAASGTNLSNYTLPTSATGAGTVLQAPLAITGVLATGKVYDATTADTLNVANAGIYGVIGSDAVALSTSGAAGTFASANAGTNIAVTTSGFNLSGAQAADYRLVQPSGLYATITPATLTISGVSAASKVYDGSTVDSLNVADAALSGIVGSDASNLVLSTGAAAGAFGSKNVGTGLSVSASGFSISGSAAPNYDLVAPMGLTADITPAPLTVSLTGNPTKPYNGTTTAGLSSSNFTLSGFVAGEGATIPQIESGEYASPNAGTQPVTATLTAPDYSPTGSTLLSNYTLPTTVTGTGTITPAPLTGVLTGNPTKVYDGTTTASLASGNYTLTGFLAGQGATVNQTAGVYGSANAGEESVTATVTAANYTATGSTLLSNYSLPTSFSGTGTITQAALAGYVYAGITGNPTKTYDGTTAATLTPANFALTGFVSGQGATVTQTVGQYASANAGSQTLSATLSAADFTADSGTNLANYTLPTSAFGTGTINPAALTVTIVGNPTRVYNGNTNMVLSPTNYSIAGFVSGQGAEVNPSALISYASANVGSQTLTAALTPSAYTANSGTSLTNYVLASSASGTGTITPAPLTITGVYATNKVYDIMTTDPLSTAAAALSGIVPVDAGNVTLVGSLSGTFSTSQAGTSIPVSVSGCSIGGPAASNYTLQPISGLAANITPAPLSITGVSANSKPYDGTAAATLNTASEALAGILGSDTVTLSAANATAAFGSVNAGNNLRVSASGFAIAGAQASDYTLSQPAGLTADITPAPITALITGNPTKVYDGSTSVTLTAGNYTLEGFAPNEGATVPQSATASYSAPDAGTNIAVNSTLVLSDFVAGAGTNLSNYQLPTAASGVGTITQAPLTVVLTGNPTKTYDGTGAAALSPASYTLSGFVGSQSASVSQTSGTYASPEAGAEAVTAALTAGSYTAGSGTDLANYALPTSASGRGTIQPASLTVIDVSTTPQTYNGTTVDALTGATLSGTIYGADNPTLAPGTYASGVLGNSGNAGTDPVTTSIGLTGAGSTNYVLVQPAGLTAVISPAPLSASSSVTKTYDGTTTANLSGSNTTFTGFVAGQGATVNAGVTGTFSGSNVGTGLAVSGGALNTADVTANNGTLLSNYVLPSSDNGTGSITAATLTYTATASSQQYGTTPAGLTGSVSGFVDGQTEATATTGVPMFSTTATSSSNVGQYAIDGSGLTASNGNYVFAQAPANATALTITPAPLTVVNVTTTSRAYNGSTADALSGATLTGVFYNGDSPTLTNSTTGTLSNSGNVGTDSVTTDMGLSGTGSGNYSLTQPSGLTAVISPVALTAASSVTKGYDGTTTASLSGSNTTLTGFVAGQGATVNAGVTGTFASANAGSGIAITGGALTGADLTATGTTNLSNYVLPTSDNGTGIITPAVVNLSGARVYDGATDAAAGIFETNGAVAGVDGQTLTLSGTGTLSSKNAGAEAISSLGTLALGNGTGAASNYTLAGGTVAVSPLGITVNATANNKVYDGTTAATAALSSTGVLPGDSLTFNDTSANFSTANVGTGEMVTISGISEIGTGSGNYTVNTTATTTANITPAVVSLTGTRTYDAASDAAASIFGSGGTVSGVNGQTLTLNGSGTLAGQNAGSEAVSSLGTLSLANGTGLASNYTLAGGTDAVTVTPAKLTYTANTLSQSYGATPSGLSGTVSGFVGGDTLASATSGAASFSTAATAASNVGSYAITGSGLSADNGNYTFVQAAGNATALTISRAIVNLSGTRTYNAAATAAASAFGTIDTGVNGQTLILSGSGTLAGKNVGSEALSSLGTLSLVNGTGLASNYTLTGGTDAVTVTPATLTYTAGTAAQSYGATPSGLSGTVSGFVGSDTLASATSGTASFSTAASAASNVGSYAITGSGLAADNGNYTFTQAAGNATALSITPAIVNLSGTRTYDAATDAAAGVFGSGGTVNGVNGQTLTLSGSGTLASKNAGSETVASLGTLTLANGTGLASNYTLTGGTDAVAVTPATLTYVAGTATQSYGTTPSGLGGTVSGFVGSDTLASATSGAASFSTAATAASNVGNYAITGSGLAADNGNYTFAQAVGNATALSITPAIVNLSGTRTYDAASDAAAGVFGSGGTVNGVNGQTLTLSGTGTLASQNAGTEAVSSLGTLSLANGTGLASNYTLAGGTDSVTVTPATLTYTAGSATQIYGVAPSGLGGTVSGFVGGDTLASATSGAASFSTAATAASNVGSYAITGSGLAADNGNYTFAQAVGNATALSITPAIVNLSGTRTYDAASDAAAGVFGSGGTVNGVNGQTLTLSGSGTLASKNVGSESLTGFGTLALVNGTGLASNYTLVGGTDAVTVTPATLTYTAGTATQSYGATPSGLSGTVSGFVGSDTLASATSGTASFSTAASAASNVGSYAITGSGLAADNGNYTFTQAAGNATALSITPAIVNLSGTRTYDGATDAGASAFGASGTLSTGINGQTLILSGTGTLAGQNAGSESVTSLGTLSLGNGTGLAANYTLVGGADAVMVTPATLTYTAGTATQSYGTTPSGFSGTVSGFIGSDTLASATSGAVSFSTVATAASNVGSYAIIGAGLAADDGNYTFAQAAGNATALGITPAIVNLSGTRTYDAATDAGASAFAASGTLSTGVNGQTLTLSGSGMLTGKNVGSEALSSLGTLSLANGTGLASNYTLVGGTDAVTVTPATLTYTAGTATQSYGATPSGLSGTVSGLVGGDTLTSATTGAASFSTAATAASNVGSYAITGSGLTADNGNYTFAQAAGNATALSITPAIVNLSGTRTYDAASDAAAGVFGSGGTVNGVNGQTLTLSGSGTLASKNAGSESLTGLGTLALANGTGVASNYTLAGGTDAVEVSKLVIAVGATGTDRVYNGTVTDAVTLASGGVLAGDGVTFSDTSSTFATKNVGSGKLVTVEGISAGGPDGGNYAVNATTTTLADITPATLTETADPVTVATGKVPALNGSVSGFVGGDTLASATTGTLVWFTDAPAYPTLGTYSIDGSGLIAANYTIVQAAGNADALRVTAMPETAATQRIYGLLGVPLSPDAIATPYGIGSNNEYGNNTGNQRQDPDPADTNRRLSDFSGRLALTILSGGVRLPQEAQAPAADSEVPAR